MSVNYYFVDIKAEEAKKQLEMDLETLRQSNLLFMDQVNLPSASDILKNTEKLHIGQCAHNTLLLKRNEAYYKSVPEMKVFYEKNKDRLIIQSEHGIDYKWDEFEKDILSDPPRPGTFFRDDEGYAWESRAFF